VQTTCEVQYSNTRSDEALRHAVNILPMLPSLLLQVPLLPYPFLYTNKYSNQSSLKVNVAQLPYMTQTVRTVVRDCRKVLLAKLFSMCRIFAQVLKCTESSPPKLGDFFTFTPSKQKQKASLRHYFTFASALSVLSED